MDEQDETLTCAGDPLPEDDAPEREMLMPTDLAISDEGIAFLTREEGGMVRHIYLDSKGLETIGVGHLLTVDDKRTQRFHHGITVAEGEALFRSDLAWVEAAIREHVHVPLTQGMYDALCSLIFNCGPSPLVVPDSVGAYLNAGDYDQARAHIPHWHPNPERRQREQALWDT